MSERDELAAIILDCQQHAQGLAKTADAIISAGYRRVPDDCVVVRRDDVEAIIELITEYGAQSTYQFHEIKRLKSALTATRHGEGDEQDNKGRYASPIRITRLVASWLELSCLWS